MPPIRIGRWRGRWDSPLGALVLLGGGTLGAALMWAVVSVAIVLAHLYGG